MRRGCGGGAVAGGVGWGGRGQENRLKLYLTKKNATIDQICRYIYTYIHRRKMRFKKEEKERRKRKKEKKKSK